MTDTTTTTASGSPVSTVHTVTARTDEDMRALGQELAGLVEPGDLLILSGSLGAGKTTLTRGLGKGWACAGSDLTDLRHLPHPPSLTGGPALVHVDAYRLGGADEIDDIDLDATLHDSVTVVEWGKGVAEELSDQRLEISIERHPDDTRTVHLHAVGTRWSHSELPGHAGCR